MIRFASRLYLSHIQVKSLDYKAPLLKALRAVDKAAVDVCHYFNPEVKKVVCLSGMGTGILPGRRGLVRRTSRLA